MRLWSLFLIATPTLFLVGCPDDPKPETGSVENDTDSGGSPDDADGDGYGMDRDCDDNDASVNPGAAELCNDIDDDCDNEIDEDVQNTYYADNDGDGYGDPAGATVQDCSQPTGYADTNDDCDDADSAIHPDAAELCDDVDNDCDGTADEGVEGTTYYADSDGDGYGNPDDTVEACGDVPGYVDNAMDCDDDDDMEPVHVSEGGYTGPDTGWGDTSDSALSNFPGSSSNPFASVQDGIDHARVCVHVSAGTYTENVDFGGKDVEVVGVDGAEDTILEGTGNGSVVTFASNESSDAVLRGFTITGGGGTMTTSDPIEVECGSGVTCVTTQYDYCGGGVYVDGSSPTLTDLIITGNSLPPYSYTATSSTESMYIYSYGGGVCLVDAAIAIEDVVISSNFADQGGGLFADSSSSVSLKWVVFDANSASAGGGFASRGSVSASNSVVVYNTADGSGGAFGGAGVDVQQGSVSLTNVTGTGNEGSASLFIDESGTLTLLNAILVDNASGYILDGDNGATLNVTYSDVYNSGGSGGYGSLADATGSDGNISDDPVFVSATGTWSSDNLHLRSSSPAVDAGSSSSTLDTDGTRNDMGAYGGSEGDW